MGPENAATRLVLMDAAESVMREEGYAAVTSRRVAERAGVNQQTVYYYFETMDDLLLATYRRRIKALEERFEQAFSSDEPLRAFWEVSSDADGAALTIEYLALSNHNATIRAETVAFGERSRRAHVEQLASVIADSAATPSLVTPFGVVMAITYISHLLGFEKALGLKGGHSDAAMLAEWLIGLFGQHAVGGDKAAT
jgi:AcrR family transcriptional regulator